MKKVWVVYQSFIKGPVVYIHVFENKDRAENFHKLNKDLAIQLGLIDEFWTIEDQTVITEEMYK